MSIIRHNTMNYDKLFVNDILPHNKKFNLKNIFYFETNYYNLKNLYLNLSNNKLEKRKLMKNLI